MDISVGSRHFGKYFLLTVLRLAAEREESKIVGDQVGAPTCAFDLAEATTGIVAGVIGGTKSQFTIPEVSGTYHMTAAGQTTWYEFAKAMLEEARRAPQNLPWSSFNCALRTTHLNRRVSLADTSSGLLCPLERAPDAGFGVTLPDWRTQLQRCFSTQAIATNPTAVLSSGQNPTASSH